MGEKALKEHYKRKHDVSKRKGFKNIQEKQKKKDKQEGEEVRQTRKLVCAKMFIFYFTYVCFRLPLSKCTATILEYLQIRMFQ